MSSFSLTFDPHLPVWAIVVLAAVAALVVAFGVWRRARGVAWRAAFLTLMLLALLNPVLTREERQKLDDIVVIGVDRSPSQRLADRPQQTEEALAALRRSLASLPNVDVREVDLGTDARRGTQLFTGLGDALARIDRSRLGGVIALTDGEVHDAPADPANLGLGAPLHVLLTGRQDENDREVTIEQAPTFAVVGEPQSLRVQVHDTAGQTAVPVVLRRDGQIVTRASAVPDQPIELPFTLEKGGSTALEVEVEERPGELTAVNNRAAVFVNGVRDRLRVLLVSGEPYPGLRVWRNLLKADPAVDLVHFTILRPPEKQDGTPIRELALIAFPSRELFEVKLKEFDLIIFDRYSRRGLLPLIYLENIARYVEEGGALLDAAGPESAQPLGLFNTPLGRVLPGRPSGEVIEKPFAPKVTEIGQRHPVTAGLEPMPAETAPADTTPPWGRWFRQVDVETADAPVLMTGFADRPLLVLSHAGEGRVAQLLSDHAWLWARGFEGGGPQATLLRRLVHWLMKEPELDEEALAARAGEDEIAVERRSLETGPFEVTVTSPSGAETKLQLGSESDGVFRGRMEAKEDGLYRVTDGTRTAYASPRPIAPAEIARMRATADIVTPVAEATGGAVRWLSEGGVPDIRRVGEGRTASGRGWIGIEGRDSYRVLGEQRFPVLPPWVALLLLMGTATIAWWREGRG
ncbi:MAG: hypothetical protein U1E45_21470 [Geminicoccaceae bacterium]